MTKLTYTEMGELIVFRLTSIHGPTKFVFPTHRKALNACHKLIAAGGPDSLCIEPVKVFPGKTDRQRVDRAREVVAHPHDYAGWRVRYAAAVLEQLGSSYPVITAPGAF